MKRSPVQAGWKRVKEFFPSVVAAGLMYGALHQIVPMLAYPLTSVSIYVINALIRKAFRDYMLLPDYAAIPWRFELRLAAVAVILFVVGSFIGLWVNVRIQPESKV